MGFQRDFGVCCFVLPLKFGAALIAMYVFVSAVFNVLALFSGEVRLQGNGYFLPLLRLPTLVGACGLFFGFFGLLGIYDDKVSWVTYFNYFFAVKVGVMISAAAADYWMLSKCDSWLSSPEHYSSQNQQMDAIAGTHACFWARYSYILGAGIDCGIHIYMLYCTYCYQKQVEASPPWLIDFGLEKYDVTGRWNFYKVSDPRGNLAKAKTSYVVEDEEEEEEDANSTGPTIYSYGAVDKGRGMYGPDGMQIQAENGAPPPIQKAPYGADGQPIQGANVQPFEAAPPGLGIYPPLEVR